MKLRTKHGGLKFRSCTLWEFHIGAIVKVAYSRNCNVLHKAFLFQLILIFIMICSERVFQYSNIIIQYSFGSGYLFATPVLRKIHELRCYKLLYSGSPLIIAFPRARLLNRHAANKKGFGVATQACLEKF